MRLRGIDFGNALGASGVQGFFGEGYWFHKPWAPLGLDFRGATFVAKTATLLAREGNMRLGADLGPAEYFPDCVRMKPARGVALNAIGLSNPGLPVLLGMGEWQRRTDPFLLSIMSLAGTPEARLDEMKAMIDLIGMHKDTFDAPIGLQINLSCPNTDHKPSELIRESAKILEVAGKLGIPVMPKYSIATAPIAVIRELQDHSDCDAICVSNTLPFGWEELDWAKVWGDTVSPLAKYKGGGLSGAPLRPLVCEWITKLRTAGFRKPINGGGGILTPEDVRHYQQAGASSIFVGSVAMLRPWRVRSIIAEANSLYWRE